MRSELAKQRFGIRYTYLSKAKKSQFLYYSFMSIYFLPNSLIFVLKRRERFMVVETFTYWYLDKRQVIQSFYLFILMGGIRKPYFIYLPHS